jgi:iron complex outermembrane receptor protein
MNFKNILIACLLISGRVFAQTDQQQIRLLDLDDALPIVGAAFQYGDQQGASDLNGVISFHYSQGNIMNISHVNYDSWTLQDEELRRVSQNQVYYRRSSIVNLYPVTVIAVRPQDQQPDEQLSIDFQQRMAHDGAAILNQTPAINSIRKSGNYGFDPVFRGFKYDQLNVVFNGAQSASAACPNRMDPPTSQMAPNMTDRIEILKGPHALRFGTGFGATINFIPAKLRFTSEPDIYGRISTGYESNGNIARGESQLGFSGERYDLSVFGSWSQGDDYQSGNGETVQADFNRGSFGANVGLKLSSNQQLRISALYNRARDVDFAALPMDLREDDTWMFNARHDIQINRNNLQSWNTTVYGSFVDHLMDNLLKPLDPRMINAQTFAQTSNYGGRTESIWQFGPGKLYAGADLRVEGAQGTRTREFLMGPNAGRIVEDNAWQDGRISKTGLFGEYHLGASWLSYVFSGRLEFNHADIHDPSDEFTEIYDDAQVSQINPSLSAGVLMVLGPQTSGGIWVGRAQRSGSLTERFINYFPVGQDPYEMLGNPQLDPEKNNQIDLTFEWKKPNTAVNVDVFISYLQDYISSVIDTTLSSRLPMSPGVRRFINIDDVFKTGFEVNWTQQLPLGLQHQLGVAYTYAQDLQRDQPLPEIAPMDMRYTLTGSYLKHKLKPEVTFRYVMEQGRISEEFGETVTPSFALLDVKVGYKLSDKLQVNAGVNNLFDENYYEHLNRSVRGANQPIYAPGRNVYGNISYLF